ncbi:dynamin family protein [Helicobacter pylori]|uniref:dynamin family protein n=1 Tax=Helicobacter pylori TaxID=210 RepID=UPI0007DB214F|nr:dynamin family protein [Helicobacter pylori]ANH43669.1 GTPase [Helicobacter pylori]
MNTQELIQKSALIEKVIKEQGLQEKAGPFISENAVIKTEELEKTIKGMQAENRGLKVGIIGRVRAGKSSLLNALIFERKDVLPKAATPMTASLTILKYAQNLSAEAQFYNEKDIEELKRDHERYEKKFKEIVSEEVKNLEEKQQGLLNKAKGVMGGIGKAFSKDHEEAPKQKILSPEEIRERAQKIAKKELDEDAKLTASHDQYERMKKNGLINPKDLETRIQADSLEELNQKLYQFVGKEGKFMPYTKAVQISLNNPNLKDLEIIDTPGVNDPVVSRESRTKALLKECDVVFMIIPSSHFVGADDIDLFDRVSNKEGIQRVYFVASQADSAVCTPSEVENSRHHLPTALTNTQKILSSFLNATMSLLEKKYPHQQEIFESTIKNGVILTSGVCFSMYKDFENQASWESKKEEYYNTLRNLISAYPDAFSSDDKSKESLLLLSNMGAIRERLEEAAKEKENIISQRLQEYLKSQANNLSSLVANLLKELESEKNRIKDADLNKISEQLKEYEKLSDKIEINFKEEYDIFVLNFIKDIKNRLNNALKEAAQTASDGIKEKEENPERVEQDGFWGGFKRLWGGVFGEDWGYESGIKAGAVIDFLKAMNKDCEDALNDQVKSFKIDFRKELYAKVLPILREIINDESLIDEVAFKKSVHAFTDKIKFEEFDHTDIPSEIEGQTGFLKGDEAKQFIESVESYVRGFEDKTLADVKKYCTYLEKELKNQNFADSYSKLVEKTQNLQNQVQNKAQSIAQLDAQIKALKEI